MRPVQWQRIPWQIAAAAVLLVLLATLATFQYRWLGEVSEAERERMRASLRTRASEFAQEFDSELTRTYLAFQVDGDRLDADPAAALAAAYARWQASATSPALVRGVYLAEGRTFDSAKLQRFDPDRRALELTAWPPDLAPLVRRTPRSLPQIVGIAPPMLFTDAVDASLPALMIPVPRVTRTTLGEATAVFTHPSAEARVLIVSLDPARLRQQWLEPLVAKYFGVGDGSEYLVTIVRRDDPSAVVYSSSNGSVDASSPW